MTIDEIKKRFSETIFWNYGLDWPGDACKDAEGELTIVEQQPTEDGDRSTIIMWEGGELSVSVAEMWPARATQDPEGHTGDADVEFVAKLPVIIPALLSEIDGLNKMLRPSASVMQPWTTELSRRMQAVLVSATRGCDGSPKEDPSKPIIRSLRAAVMVPSDLKYDAMNPVPEDVNTFMAWHPQLSTFMTEMLGSLDQYPLHFVMHLLHAAQIVGTYHPDENVAKVFGEFYKRACHHNLHTQPESVIELERRLRDR